MVELILGFCVGLIFSGLLIGYQIYRIQRDIFKMFNYEDLENNVDNSNKCGKI